jgi:hypothetical protein
MWWKFGRAGGVCALRSGCKRVSLRTRSRSIWATGELTPIINVAWWIDNGHGALLVAAGLVLLRQHWQAAVRRIAKNVALFAGALGGSFAVLHTGRPQYIYFLFPYPNNLGLWPQWRSPLMWDFFAILAFLLYTLVFSYANMVPDLAVLRDRASTRARQVLYGIVALGWRGSAHQ